MPQPEQAPSDRIHIGEAARRFGVATSALRFYEDRGLLTPAARVGGRRWYGRAELRRIAFIRTAQQLGMNLDDIATLIHSDGTGWRDLVSAHIDQLRRQQEWIDATLATLHSALACPRNHPLLDCDHLIDTLDHWIDGPYGDNSDNPDAAEPSGKAPGTPPPE